MALHPQVEALLVELAMEELPPPETIEHLRLVVTQLEYARADACFIQPLRDVIPEKTGGTGHEDRAHSALRQLRFTSTSRL